MAITSTRPQPHFLAGYVSEDGGTVSAMTAVGLTVSEQSEQISYNASTKKISLPKDNSYKIQVELNQTGGSATFEIYDSTATTVLQTSGTGAGRKSLTAYVRTTTAAKDIQIRVDDQSANGSTSSTGIVLVESI